MNPELFWRVTFWNTAQSMESARRIWLLQIGIDVKTFARIERAEVHTNLEILDCISRGTGMTPAQLLTPLYQGIPVASVHNKLPA